MTTTWTRPTADGRGWELVEITRGEGAKSERVTGERFPSGRAGYAAAMAECERRNRAIARPVAS